MLNNRQKAQLRGMANTLRPVGQIGKAGLSDNLLDFLDDALESTELIKLRVLKNCGLTVNELAVEIDRCLHCQLVQSIGRTLIFYRRSKEKPEIRLVK